MARFTKKGHRPTTTTLDIQSLDQLAPFDLQMLGAYDAELRELAQTDKRAARDRLLWILRAAQRRGVIDQVEQRLAHHVAFFFPHDVETAYQRRYRNEAGTLPPDDENPPGAAPDDLADDLDDADAYWLAAIQDNRRRRGHC